MKLVNGNKNLELNKQKWINRIPSFRKTFHLHFVPSYCFGYVCTFWWTLFAYRFKTTNNVYKFSTTLNCVRSCKVKGYLINCFKAMNLRKKKNFQKYASISNFSPSKISKLTRIFEKPSETVRIGHWNSMADRIRHSFLHCRSCRSRYIFAWTSHRKMNYLKLVDRHGCNALQ